MAEDVVIRPAGKVEPGTCRKEVEAGLRDFCAVLAGQTHDQDFMHRVQIAHVGCGIVLLRIGQFRSAPVAGLLLLGHFLAEQFAHEVLGAAMTPK